MSDAITPAMDGGQWDYFTSGGIRKHVMQDAVAAGERDRVHDLTSHALAALALHGQPFGFTHEDVEALLEDAAEWDDRSDIFAGRSARLRSLASRIAALLPPSP